jgi:hypothetical protein
LGTKLIHSSANHPQTSGQTERVNQILEDMLRACVLEFPQKWDDCLPLAEFSYNNSYQESIKVGDYVYLKVSPMKDVTCFGVKGKLAPWYIGPFLILEQCGPVAYQLELPETLSIVHNMFHVSQLKKCLRVPDRTIEVMDVALESDLTYSEHPIRVLDQRDRIT